MEWIQTLTSGGIGAAIAVGLFALIQIPFNKKLRTPADRLASEEFAYKLLKERLDDANADRKVLTETVNYLREDARKRDATDAEDFEREQTRLQLIRDLNDRIMQLQNKISAYESRLERLAEKVRQNLPITLGDIYETPGGSTLDLDDVLGEA